MKTEPMKAVSKKVAAYRSKHNRCVHCNKPIKKGTGPWCEVCDNNPVVQSLYPPEV